MSPNFKLCATAAAVASVFALQAHAAAPAGVIVGAGASAIVGTLEAYVLSDLCDTTKTINFSDNAASIPTKLGAGSVIEISCTPLPAANMSSSTLTVSYDTTGGSWKAFTSFYPALLTAAQNNAGSFNLNPVKTIDPTTCAASLTFSATLQNGLPTTVTYNYGCSAVALATTDTVTYGLTDVEPSLFNNSQYNRPLKDGTWNTTPSYLSPVWKPGPEASGFPLPAFTVIFGVAASKQLWLDMQQDQIHAGYLPGCTAGATTVESCTPFLSRAQYSSIVSGTGGSLTQSAKGLFITDTHSDYSLELARRDQGSGTQASSNAYFLNQGCSSSATEHPDAPLGPGQTVQWAAAGTSTITNTITYNAGTGDVIQRLQLYTATTDPTANQAPPTSSYVIGVVSAEKYKATTITDSGAPGTSTAGWGFFRLEGTLPTVNNFNAGLYNYASTEHLHCNPNASADGLTLCQDLASTTAADSILNYKGTGIVPLGAGTVAGGNYTNIGKICSGQRHS